MANKECAVAGLSSRMHAPRATRARRVVAGIGLARCTVTGNDIAKCTVAAKGLARCTVCS